jgi:hypothetical protein
VVSKRRHGRKGLSAELTVEDFAHGLVHYRCYVHFVRHLSAKLPLAAFAVVLAHYDNFVGDIAEMVFERSHGAEVAIARAAVELVDMPGGVFKVCLEGSVADEGAITGCTVRMCGLHMLLKRMGILFAKASSAKGA